MIELALAGWIYFEACGFYVPESGEISAEVRMTRAPNISGFWVRKGFIIGVVDWKKARGKTCSSIYIRGHDLPLHIIGSAEEVLEKLQE